MNFLTSADKKWDGDYGAYHYVMWTTTERSPIASIPEEDDCSDWLFNSLRRQNHSRRSPNVSNNLLYIYVPRDFITIPSLHVQYVRELIRALQMHARPNFKLSLFYGKTPIPIDGMEASFQDLLKKLDKRTKRNNLRVVLDYRKGKSLNKGDATLAQMFRDQANLVHFFFSMIRSSYAERARWLVDWGNLFNIFGLGFWQSVGISHVAPGYSHWPASRIIISNESAFATELRSGLTDAKAKSNRVTCTSLVSGLVPSGFKPNSNANSRLIEDIYKTWSKNKKLQKVKIGDLILMQYTNRRMYDLIMDLSK